METTVAIIQTPFAFYLRPLQPDPSHSRLEARRISQVTCGIKEFCCRSLQLQANAPSISREPWIVQLMPFHLPISFHTSAPVRAGSPGFAALHSRSAGPAPQMQDDPSTQSTARTKCQTPLILPDRRRSSTARLRPTALLWRSLL